MLELIQTKKILMFFLLMKFKKKRKIELIDNIKKKHKKFVGKIKKQNQRIIWTLVKCLKYVVKNISHNIKTC